MYYIELLMIKFKILPTVSNVPLAISIFSLIISISTFLSNLRNRALDKKINYFKSNDKGKLIMILPNKLDEFYSNPSNKKTEAVIKSLTTLRKDTNYLKYVDKVRYWKVSKIFFLLEDLIYDYNTMKERERKKSQKKISYYVRKMISLFNSPKY